MRREGTRLWCQTNMSRGFFTCLGKLCEVLIACNSGPDRTWLAATEPTNALKCQLHLLSRNLRQCRIKHMGRMRIYIAKKS